ncbi:hypothetical protein SDJN03_04627, partial [Cucurbita argyrosperma subsp. sororia]
MPLLENPFASSNYVPSGLGYCFIAMGSDEEVPYGSLNCKVMINSPIPFPQLHKSLKSLANLFKSEQLQALRTIILIKRIYMVFSNFPPGLAVFDRDTILYFVKVSPVSE